MSLEKAIAVHQRAMDLYLDNYRVVDNRREYTREQVIDAMSSLIKSANLLKASSYAFNKAASEIPNSRTELLRYSSIGIKYAIISWMKVGHPRTAIILGFKHRNDSHDLEYGYLREQVKNAIALERERLKRQSVIKKPKLSYAKG
jgi:hypothetical protein